MPQFMRPSYANGFARHPGESMNPGAWKGLVGLWAPMLGPTGLTLRDWSLGKPNHGTLTAMDPATDWVVTPRGYALNFDGVNDQTLHGDVLDFEYNDPMTLIVVAATTNSGDTKLLLSKMTGAAAYRGYDFYKGAGADELVFILRNDNNADKMIWVRETNAKGIHDGDFHHLAATYSGSGLASGVTLYIDGQVQPDDDVKDTLVSSTTVNAAELCIGNLASGGFSWAGNISLAMIYSRKLPASEVAERYEDASALLGLRKKTYIRAPAVTGSPWYYRQQERVVA